MSIASRDILKRNDLRKVLLKEIDTTEDLSEILTKLHHEIHATRDLLNNIVCCIDDSTRHDEILKVSKYMDKLLNKYGEIMGRL